MREVKLKRELEKKNEPRLVAERLHFLNFSIGVKFCGGRVDTRTLGGCTEMIVCCQGGGVVFVVFITKSFIFLAAVLVS